MSPLVPRRLTTAVALLLTLPLLATAMNTPEGGARAIPVEEATTDTAIPATEGPDAPSATPVARDAPQPQAGPPRSLFLAIGHGRTPGGRFDPGSMHPRSKVREVDTAAVMVKAMAEVLADAPGLRLWVESGNHPNMHGSVVSANRVGADDCIEVHQEWAGAPPGAFAHWYPTSKAGRQLGDRLVAGLRTIGIPTRAAWHKPRPGLYFLRKTTCRAVLVEVGRVGDLGKKELKEAGRAMARAYLEDIGHG